MQRSLLAQDHKKKGRGNSRIERKQHDSRENLWAGDLKNVRCVGAQDAAASDNVKVLNIEMLSTGKHQAKRTDSVSKGTGRLLLAMRQSICCKGYVVNEVCLQSYAYTASWRRTERSPGEG
eukprot:1142671-Pelagomonas_calceolata.AAC.1